MAGWEDILLDHSEKSQEETQIKSEHFNYEVIPYVWNNSWGGGREDMIYKFANLGFKTVKISLCCGARWEVTRQRLRPEPQETHHLP